MKRSHSIVLAAAGAATVAALVPLAPVLASTSASSSDVRLRLIETSTAFHAIDAPAPEADGQAGDTITFESTLSKGAKTVGSLEGHCIQVRADGTLDDCDVTVTVGGDSFRMSGPFDPAKGGTLTITGGTGAWVGAGGTDQLVNQPDGTTVHTITLSS